MELDDHTVRGSASTTVERVAEYFRAVDGLVWLHGQGSVITGISAESDLDFVAVWYRMPTEPLSLSTGNGLACHGPLAVEHFELNGWDVDVQHVPLPSFEEWIASLAGGEGWSGEQWPMPTHVAAGLATGLLVVDELGVGARFQRQVQVPVAHLVDTVVGQLMAAGPDFANEMDRASKRGDFWLCDVLANRLHKMIYTAWFLLEGHYPPFPKHLPDWYDRFGMNAHVRHLEAACWIAHDRDARTKRLSKMVEAVVNLNR